MIDVAIENDKPVRIGVNWGSLDQALLRRLMDDNARLPEPKDAREVMIDAIILSAMESAQMARSTVWVMTKLFSAQKSAAFKI